MSTNTYFSEFDLQSRHENVHIFLIVLEILFFIESDVFSLESIIQTVGTAVKNIVGVVEYR